MRNLSTTIAVYIELTAAETDWHRLEEAAKNHHVDLADAALVQHADGGETFAVHRLSHHGWGKGAVAGAVVGVLFPPALLGAAIVGAGGGAVVARLNRSLDRSDIKDLGEVMDESEIAIVALTSTESAPFLETILPGARKRITRASSTAEDVQEALNREQEAAGPATT